MLFRCLQDIAVLLARQRNVVSTARVDIVATLSRHDNTRPNMSITSTIYFNTFPKRVDIVATLVELNRRSRNMLFGGS